MSFAVRIWSLSWVAHFIPDSTLHIEKPIKFLEFMLGQLALIGPWLAIEYKEECVHVKYFEVLPPIVHWDRGVE